MIHQCFHLVDPRPVLPFHAPFITEVLLLVQILLIGLSPTGFRIFVERVAIWLLDPHLKMQVCIYSKTHTAGTSYTHTLR